MNPSNFFHVLLQIVGYDHNVVVHYAKVPNGYKIRRICKRSMEIRDIHLSMFRNGIFMGVTVPFSDAEPKESFFFWNEASNLISQIKQEVI